VREICTPLGANPNIFQTPEGFKRVSQFLEGIANNTLNEQKEFLAAKKAGLKPDEYSDFPANVQSEAG
jgi:hypothetical protein